MTVSRETEALLKYAALIRKWNPAINLVAPSTLSQIDQRHIADSLQLVDLSASAAGRWVDLGSGGGLPGLVVAVCRPDLAVSLVESDQRKCSFLRNAIRELELANCSVLTGRIEAIETLNADQVSARALAPLPLLLSYVHRHLAPGGRAWLMKGRNWHDEVRDARLAWQFEMIPHPSKTEPGAVIVEISDLRHV